MGQNVIHDAQAFDRMQFLQDPLAVRVAEIDILSDKVCQLAWIASIQYRRDKFVIEVGNQILIFAK